MKNFRKERRSGRREGGRRSFGVGEGNGGSKMFSATCAECGNPCEVPFRPKPGRPVFCNDCFGKNNHHEERRSDDGRNFRPDHQDRRMFSATCAECGNPCEVPFRPTAGKPVYCKSCFDRRGNRNNRESLNQAQQNPDQFATLNAKLDKIISLLAVPNAVTVKKTSTEIKVKPKAKAKKKLK